MQLTLNEQLTSMIIFTLIIRSKIGLDKQEFLLATGLSRSILKRLCLGIRHSDSVAQMVLDQSVMWSRKVIWLRN